MSAAFLVLLAIIAHRFLRLDLVEPTGPLVAGLRPPLLLSALLVLSVAVGLWRRSVRLRASLPLLVQWALWLWAGLTRVVSDGLVFFSDYLRGDYTKDVIFASLTGVITDSLRKLRALCWLFVAVMTLVAAITITQQTGQRKCFHFKWSKGALNYEQKTDGRKCFSAAECNVLPPGEEHLRDEGWACERQGSWGLGTVLDRVRYTGTLADPNALSLALVMAVAMALGLLFWPPAEGLSWLSPRRRLVQVGLIAAILLMSLVVRYAASRAALGALALTFGVFLYARVGLIGMAAAAALGGPLALMTNRKAAEQAYSTFTRIQTQLNGYEAYLEHPLFGVGYGNYERISFITAHNSFLLTATETGVIGGALFVLGIYVAFKFLVQVRRFQEEDLADQEERERQALEHRRWEGGRWVYEQGAIEEPEADRRAELRELRHAALMMMAMLVGVGACVSFLSLAFDVMWLFPVGILAAFYRIVHDRLPEYQFRIHLPELLGVALVGGFLPVLFALAASRGL